MNLITIEVICPSTSGSYDFKLPVKMSAGEIKRQIMEDIRSFEGLPELFVTVGAYFSIRKTAAFPTALPLKMQASETVTGLQ